MINDEVHKHWYAFLIHLDDSLVEYFLQRKAPAEAVVLNLRVENYY
jgi:hypothetical protein